MGRLTINGGKPVVPEGFAKSWPEVTEEDREVVLQVLDSGVLAGPYAP